jgi:hypothetical protein
MTDGIARRETLVASQLELLSASVANLLPRAHASPPDSSAVPAAISVVSVEAVDQNLAVATDEAMVFVGPRGNFATLSCGRGSRGGTRRAVQIACEEVAFITPCPATILQAVQLALGHPLLSQETLVDSGPASIFGHDLA